MSLDELMTTDVLQQAQHPYYMGIKYAPKDYEFVTPDEAVDWQWSVDETTRVAIADYGITVSRLEDENQFPEQVATFVRNHQANKYILQHFQQRLSGLKIIIPDNVVIKQPLNLIIDLMNSRPGAFTITVLLGEGSQLTLQQTINMHGAATQASCVIIGQQANNSQLTLATAINNQTPMKLSLFGTLDVARDCQTNWSLVPGVYGKLLGDVAINLNGQGSTAKLNAVKIGINQDYCGLQGSVNHWATHTTSRINMRGVLFGKSKVNFTSIGQINHGAYGSDSQQEGRLMTVGEKAQGTVNPLLIIDENDVNAGHAASVGQYDPEELYYLLSRGITKQQARKILVYNFIAPVVHELNDNFQKMVVAAVEKGAGEDLYDKV